MLILGRLGSDAGALVDKDDKVAPLGRKFKIDDGANCGLLSVSAQRVSGM